MLKINKIIVVSFTILLSTAISSCDFLEVTPVGRTTLPLFFSDMEGMRAALPGAYSAVFSYYDGQFYKYPEVAGDMIYLKSTGENGDMVNQYNFTSAPEDETEAVGAIWTKAFEAMANINNIIEYHPLLMKKFPKSQSELNNILAQALFLRALCHFDICRVYAQPYNYTPGASHLGIPVLEHTPLPNDNVNRKSTKEVYDLIINDLRKSISLFGETPMKDPFHASKVASQALLSRVFLYAEQWDSCLVYSDKVLDKITLSEGKNYIAMFQEMLPGDEAIFRLNGTLKSKAIAKFYDPNSPVAVPADTLISLYKNDPDDIRLKLLTNDGGNSYTCCKYYITADVTDENKSFHPFILRASEIYLNRAEAYLNKGDLKNAALSTKAIIARAHNKKPNEVSVPDQDIEALKRCVEIERIKELAFEGHRFYDITRRKQDLVRDSKTNSSVKRINYPSDYFVLPISQYELNANHNMQPNPTVN